MTVSSMADGLDLRRLQLAAVTAALCCLPRPAWPDRAPTPPSSARVAAALPRAEMSVRVDVQVSPGRLAGALLDLVRR